MESVYLALIVAIPALLSPLLMSWLTNRHRRSEKAEDYARQDLVADRLNAANERAAAAAKLTNTKLDVIHALVNSNLTSAMQAELDARRSALVLMIEIADLKKVAGLDPTEDAIAAMGATKGVIAKIEAALAERAKQAKDIEKIQNDKMMAALKKDAP